MTHASDEVLVRLALGHDVDPAQASHVEGCPVCSTEVAELSQLRDLMREEAHRPEPARMDPGPHVWDRIVAATAVDDRPAAEPATGPRTSAPPLAPVIPLTPAVAEGPRRRRTRGWWVAAVAAACLVLGLFVGRAVWRPDDARQVLASTSLTTLDAARLKEGTAVLLETSGTQQLQVDTAPMQPQSAAGGGYIEVWLINTDGKRMVSIGIMSTDKETFSLPPNAISQGYTVVDLSREQFDDKPAHSGESIMRGTLPV